MRTSASARALRTALLGWTKSGGGGGEGGRQKEEPRTCKIRPCCPQEALRRAAQADTPRSLQPTPVGALVLCCCALRIVLGGIMRLDDDAPARELQQCLSLRTRCGEGDYGGVGTCCSHGTRGRHGDCAPATPATARAATAPCARCSTWWPACAVPSCFWICDRVFCLRGVCCCSRRASAETGRPASLMYPLRFVLLRNTRICRCFWGGAPHTSRPAHALPLLGLRSSPPSQTTSFVPQSYGRYTKRGSAAWPRIALSSPRSGEPSDGSRRTRARASRAIRRRRRGRTSRAASCT